MADNRNRKKNSAFLERFLNMVDSVSEESYADSAEQEIAEEPAVMSAETREIFDCEKAEELPVAEETRKIDRDEISRLFDTGDFDSDPENEENESTLVFKSPAVEVENDDNIDETHIFKVTAEDGQAEPEAGGDGAEKADEYEARDFRPIRRSRHYRVGCMGGLMYFIVVVCVSALLAGVGWLAANDVLSLNKELVTAEIVVDEDFTIEGIAQQLEEKGIIEYPFLFKIFSSFSSAAEKITPGTYELSSRLDYRAIVTNLHETSGSLKTVEVTIPEGRNMMQTFKILEDNGVCSVEKLLECAMNYEFDYDFLDPEKLGTEKRLEGYLFPDTYEFYINSTPEAAISKFLSNFNHRVKDYMYLKAEEMGYSFDEIITIASMIEMEAASDSERTTIASIIYNRLNSSDFQRLQIDATVQYALGEHKDKLTYDDLNVDSPYNTYLYEGLPPGPISNPGITSIGAALNPDNTNYYYYALATDGTHRFFTYYSSFTEFVNSSEYGG